MEEHYNELGRASIIYEHWIAVCLEPRVWVRWSKFEEERSKYDKAHEGFLTTPQFFGDEEEQIKKVQAVFNAFTKMETHLKECNHARMIYEACSTFLIFFSDILHLLKFALDCLPWSKSSNLCASYTKFEKQHGTRSVLESTILGKRRIQYYEDEAAHDGCNYDAWFDYARLEDGALRTLWEQGCTEDEENEAVERMRDIYERAVAHAPPG